MRLGFVTGRPVFLDGENTWIDPGVGRLVDRWAAESTGFTMAASAAPSHLPNLTHRLEHVTRANVRPLPWMPSYARGFHKVRGSHRGIRFVESRSDVVVIQLPFTAPLALLPPRTPRVYHLCANVVALASETYHGKQRWLALPVAHFIDGIQRLLVQDGRSRLVTNGDELYEAYGRRPGRAVVSTSLLRSEVSSSKRARPADAPFRILFVGYLRPEKGIDTLLEAFQQLLLSRPEAELVIVGHDKVGDDSLSREIARVTTDLRERGKIRMLGPRAFGPELFQCFADADVLAVPSRSEGTPRVIVEARAFGCAVVASAVGGIPSSVEHEVDGLLIAPGDPGALHDALLRIATDDALRSRLVAAGLARAREMTVESFADAISAEALLAHRSVKEVHP